ncbi:hypothetical protein ACWXWB_13180 [Pantoea dispersa]|uniref:hypothetical protein n=1 Tax=Pantoea dispersa TaxID=59814 RepID=UPI002DB9BF74|nr:hypothetical protein [Pantoea dispersa]MEB5973396.1 hypothetical protein [Pantoea dispersa]
MWMNRGIPVNRLLAFLPGMADEKKQCGKRKALIASLRSSLSLATPSLLPQPALDHYPWCFVLPAPHVSSGLYLTGAFVVAEEPCTIAGVAVLLRGTDLGRLLKQDSSLPFWMMRALAGGGQQADPGALREQIAADCQPLVARMTLPRWQQHLRPVTRHAQLLHRLSQMHCEADFVLEGKRAVDVMPWRHWPDCVLHTGYLWLWRQNRQGQIIESQRKSLGKPMT